MSTILRLLLLTALLAGPLAAAPKPWSQLKVGTPAPEVLALLGDPVCARTGKGFETWIYDDGAEVLLWRTGTVIGWTEPAEASLPNPSRDIWSEQPAGRYYASMYSVLPRPLTKKTDVARMRTLLEAAATAGTGYEQYLRNGKS